MSTTNKELESLNKDLLKKINELENQLNRQRDYQQIRDENTALNAQKSELTQKIQVLNSEKTELTATIQSLETKIRAEQQQSKEALNKLTSEKDELNKKLQAVDKEKETLTKSVLELEGQLAERQDYQQLKEQNTSLATNSHDLEKSSKDLQVKLNKLEEQLKAFGDYQELKTQNETLTSNLKKMEVELSAAKEKITANESAQDSEMTSLKDSIKELTSNVEKLNEDKSRLEKEIESSRSIIKDLNKDFDDHLKEIESLKEEKASLVSELESQSVKITSDAELNATKPSNGKYDSLTNENSKLQESNRELLEKLENLEKSSERKISDMTQEIEELLENSKHYVHINAELNELKAKYDQLKKQNGETTQEINGNDSTDSDEFTLVKSERDELSNRLKKIMSEVEDVSNKNLFLEQKVENYLILEQSNERLKSTNEKLSRQLDETLVSSELIAIFTYFIIEFVIRSRCTITKASKPTLSSNISETSCSR